MTAGQTLVAVNEAGTVGTSPFTYQTTNHTTQVLDLAVIYAAIGISLTLVASSPTQGQFPVSAGAYTFNSADSGASIFVSYTYTLSTAGDPAVLQCRSVSFLARGRKMGAGHPRSITTDPPPGLGFGPARAVVIARTVPQGERTTIP
jgi:hypothetical protein